MVGLFKTHGAVAFCILFAGLAALLTAVLSVMFPQSKRAPKAGVAALGLVALTCTLTVVVVMRSRLMVDRAAKELEEPVKAVFLDRGYAEAGDIAKLGLIFGLPALAAGILGTLKALAALKQRERDAGVASSAEPQLGELSDSMLGLGALVVGSLAVFSTAALVMSFILKPPKAELAADDPARQFQEAETLLGDGKVAEGCKALEDAFARSADPKKARVRSVEGLVSECFDQKLEQAQAASSPEEFDAVTASLQSTKMPLDDAQKKRLDDVLQLRKQAAPE